jgi:hypothetical protein
MPGRKETEAVLPETIPLGTSFTLTLWIMLASVAAAMLSLLYLPLIVSWPSVLLLATCACRALRLHARLTHLSAVVAIRWGVADVSYRLHNGQWLHGRLQNGGLVTRWVTLMRIRDALPSKQTRYIVLTPDNVGVQAFRESRRQMLWGRRMEERSE